MPIDANDIIRVDNIFSAKGWNKSSGAFLDIYEKTLELISELNNPEKEVLFTLLNGFSKYGLDVYEQLLLEAVRLIPCSLLSDYNRVIFLPIKKPSDVNKTKSSDMLPYIMKTTVMSKTALFTGKTILYLSTHLELLPMTIDAKTLIIAMDDFVGSGKTIKEFYSQIEQVLPAKNKQVIFLSLVCMRAAQSYLSSKGLILLSSKIERRGISDNPLFADKIMALNVLRGATERLSIQISRYRGWYKSEALVAMMNTPNNTFPIFWSVKRKGAVTEWPAPFRRVK